MERLYFLRVLCVFFAFSAEKKINRREEKRKGVERIKYIYRDKMIENEISEAVSLRTFG
jgi:hypothetical protein